MQQQLWQFTADLTLAQIVLDLFQPHRARSPISIPNEDVVLEFHQDIIYPLAAAATPGTQLRIDPLPPPLQLRVTEPGIAPNYFNIGYEFVSAKLRKAMALDGDDVQWFEVDARGSTPEIVAQDYRVLHVVHWADALDRERTNGEMTDHYLADGSIEQRWNLPMPDPNAAPLRIAFRHDFVAPAPIFRTLPTMWTLVTDDLADRVVRSGIEDVVFYSPENDGTRTDISFRPE